MSDTSLLKKVSGQLYFVPIAEYNANKGSLPEYTGATVENWITSYDTIFNPETTGVLTDYSYSFGGENEETIYVMGCGNNVALDTIDRITNMTATVASLNNYDFMSSVLNADLLTVVGSTKNVVAEAHGTGWTVGVPFKLNNQNHDSTIVTNIVVYADAVPLTATTDYIAYLDTTTGATYITPVTAQAGVITVDYDYTTASSEIMGVQNKTINVPRTAYKFISCSYRNEDDAVTPWRRDVIYFTECKLSGELTQKYYKQGDTFEGSEVTFLADTGVAVVKTLKGATEADVNVAV